MKNNIDWENEFARIFVYIGFVLIIWSTYFIISNGYKFAVFQIGNKAAFMYVILLPIIMAFAMCIFVHYYNKKTKKVKEE